MEKRIFLAFLTVSLLASSACAFEIIFDPTVDIGTVSVTYCISINLD